MAYPIALILLQAERDRLLPDHYMRPVRVDRPDECTGCQDLQEVIREIRELTILELEAESRVLDGNR